MIWSIVSSTVPAPVQMMLHNLTARSPICVYNGSKKAHAAHSTEFAAREMKPAIGIFANAPVDPYTPLPITMPMKWTQTTL